MPKSLKKKVYEIQGGYHVFNVREGMKVNDGIPTPTVGDDESINNLALDTESLLENSDKTRRALSNKKKGIVKIPRPPNAFIIYRREMKAKHDFSKKTEADISREVGEMWRKESDDVKDFYFKLADHAKKRHKEKYVNYKYKPERGKICSKNDIQESVDHAESPPDSDLNTVTYIEPVPESYNHDTLLPNYAYYVN
ncbi:hypothetical protein RclHR1_00570024 [Rhizophagus clarus]|uniref:High mobility group box domain-containing protein n=1 Tax=Rhizophagus clarus TaxID=94130 RepID=A0A2Z6RNA1_9GLOM|nr:hypothetical protein RclHR1_00570024 [Rhizophagus clarus]GET04209.1 high mobility group box domain-containing protein [Rhizophagus clarus]